jgi:hypothetical protein
MELGEIECEALNWIHQAQDNVQLQELVKAVMKLSVHKRWGIS